MSDDDHHGRELSLMNAFWAEPFCTFGIVWPVREPVRRHLKKGKHLRPSSHPFLLSSPLSRLQRS